SASADKQPAYVRSRLTSTGQIWWVPHPCVAPRFRGAKQGWGIESGAGWGITQGCALASLGLLGGGNGAVFPEYQENTALVDHRPTKLIRSQPPKIAVLLEVQCHHQPGHDDHQDIAALGERGEVVEVVEGCADLEPKV